MANARECDKAPHSLGGSKLGTDGIRATQRAVRKQLVASLEKRSLPILRRRAWKRLESTVVEYEQELQGRAKSSGSCAGYLVASQGALRAARAALEDGNIDQGWRCLFTAQRLELLALEKEELNAAAISIRHEAVKLNAWRKSAVIEVLARKDGQDQDPHRVFRAALLRDEHYNNEAYKDGLRRGSALRLAIVLVIAVLGLLWLSSVGYLSETIRDPAIADGPNMFKVLVTVAVVGLLGATMSAITNTPKSEGAARIPEMASTIRITILRLLMGPVSAILLYFVIHSNLYAAIFSLSRPDGYAMLMVAFVAGFSERLVLRVVRVIEG